MSNAATAKREATDLTVLDNFDRIYKTQQQAISRRLLGGKLPTQNRAVAYLTDEEMEAVKGLAESVGMNVSTLIRMTMTTLAAAGLPGTSDPRLG
jgi:predicted DNA binding CopG/RHH family protein